MRALGLEGLRYNMKMKIELKEMIKQILLILTTSGWWAFARWPMLGAGDARIGMSILFGLLPTIILVVWLVAWCVDEL